jgi:hypothetical protein
MCFKIGMQRGIPDSTPIDGQPYNGYLAPYVDRIRELHGRGATTRKIAETLFALGARAATSDPNPRFKMSREHHVGNLRMMVLHVLNRLGLPSGRRKDDRVPFMVERRSQGATYREIADEFGLSLERARQIVIKATRPRPWWRGDKLTVRTGNAIYNLLGESFAGLTEAEAALAVSRLDRRQVERTPNLGKTSLRELDAWLARHGLKLRPELELRPESRRLIHETSESKKGAPSQERPCDSDDPFAAGQG